MTQQLIPGAPTRGREPIAKGILDPDHELLTRWRRGDESAFESLVKRHERRVYRLLLRLLGDPTEAEDVSQEAFLNLYRYGHRFRSESRFSTFIYRVAVNAALNRRRTLGRNRARMRKLAERQATGLDLPNAPPDPSAALDQQRIKDRVHVALGQIAPHLRIPLVLCDLEGLAYSEIARVLRLAEGTVKSRIHRARRALRDQLQELIPDQEAAP